MISIIICSRTKAVSEALKTNVQETIGVDCEFVVVDNSKNDYTIFTAYNEGVRRAKGDILCFMHEDIVFHSQDWGKVVTKAFDDKTIGCVGIIGSWYLPKRETTWWLCHADAGVLRQGDCTPKGRYFTFIEGVKPQKELTDVVVVDGCWLCIPKAMFNDIRFDDKTYNSFHCYDIDICMQVLNANKRVVVCADVDIEHKSMGNVATTFYSQLSLFFQKWQHMLPISKGLQLTPAVETWVEEILTNYHKEARRNVVLENSRRYKLVNHIKSWFK